MSMDGWLFFGSVCCTLVGLVGVIAARLMLNDVIERQRVLTVLNGLVEAKLRDLKREQAKAGGSNGKAANG